MSLGIFIQGLDTEESVLDIRTKALADLGGGLSITSYSIENNSVSKTITLPPRIMIEECNAFLRKINPEQYGRTVKRTAPKYLD